MNIIESYVFGEESDFLTFNNKDITHEIEVKISKSDFLADFKKSKHKFFESLVQGKNDVVIRGGEENELCSLDRLYKDYDFRYVQKLRYFKEGYGREPVWTPPKYIYQPWCCRVDFHKVKKERYPNKFSFAVPEGLISKDEVPEYAGLYYVYEDSGEVREIKRAKFLHQEPYNNWKYLARKLYFHASKHH